MAIAGLSVAQEMGMRVPGDLSIVAWDDSPLCTPGAPAADRGGPGHPAYGAHAARQLLASIAGERIENFQDTTPRLAPRGSTAPPVR